MRFFSILSLLCLSTLFVSQGEASVTVATVAAVVTTGSTLIGLYRSYNMNGCWPRNIDDSHKLVLSKYNCAALRHCRAGTANRCAPAPLLYWHGKPLRCAFIVLAWQTTFLLF